MGSFQVLFRICYKTVLGHKNLVVAASNQPTNKKGEQSKSNTALDEKKNQKKNTKVVFNHPQQQQKEHPMKQINIHFDIFLVLEKFKYKRRT